MKNGLKYQVLSANNVPGMQVPEIFEIWIFHIFKSFWPPKVNITRIKRPTEQYLDVVKGRIYGSSGQEK